MSRWLRTFGVQPHRTRTFKLSNDPFFIEKVRDIAGLYLLWWRGAGEKGMVATTPDPLSPVPQVA